MKLKEKLVALRKEKGLTQLDVAEKLDVSRQAISRWESGTALPSTDNLRCLSSLYEVPIDYLLKEDAERKSNPANEPAPNKIQRKNKKTVAIIAAALVGILAMKKKQIWRIVYVILSVASVVFFIYCMSVRDLRRLLPSIICVIFTIIYCIKNFKTNG